MNKKINFYLKYFFYKNTFIINKVKILAPKDFDHFDHIQKTNQI